MTAQLLSRALVDDQLLKVILVLATLVAGIALVFLLFIQSKGNTSTLVIRLLTDAIQKHRFEQELASLTSLEACLEREKGDLARIQVQKDIEEDLNKKAVLEQSIKDKEDKIQQLRSQLHAERDRARNEAQGFAEELVGEAISRPLDASDLGHNRFFLEFTTVIVIIVAIIILGLLGVLGGNEIAPLLGAIAGYVLGRTSRDGKQHQ